MVYRSHAAELLDRVVNGADTRLPSAAELCVACAEISLRIPLHGPAAGVYFRQWMRAFPDHPATPDQADVQVHYETLFGTTMDDLEQKLRRAMVDSTRMMPNVACSGRHHGRTVHCRYATDHANDSMAHD